MSREATFEQWAPLAWKLAHKAFARYNGAFDSPEDAFQESAIGLLKAIDGYDPDRGARFVTYAWACCWRYLQRAVLAGRLVDVPANHTEALHPPQPCDSEYVTLARLALVIRPLPGYYRKGEWRTGDLEDRSEPNADPDRFDVLYSELRRLPGRYRTVLVQRFGIGVPRKTMAEVALMLGVSKERIRQLQNVALERLHKRRWRLRDAVAQT